MIDVSAAKAKERARLYAASWEPVVGPAGVELTRRQPVLLADRQARIVDKFVELVEYERRDAYRSAVLARLSGAPGDAAVVMAATNAAIEGGFITVTEMISAGLASSGGRFVVADRYRKPGGSREINEGR
jgi:hypothetical protein